MKRVEIWKDEYDGQYKIDWDPESGVRDRRGVGFRTLKVAREYVDQRAWETGKEYKAKYIGSC